MASARHGLHALAAPSPFLLRRSALNLSLSSGGRNHVAIGRHAKALVVQAKKLESSPSSGSSSSSGKNAKKPDSSKVAVTDQSQVPASNPPATSSTPSPNEEYFDPGMVPDFWEGEQWNWLGFILQYLWAIGIVVAAITCAILFVTYKPREIDYRPRERPTLEDVRKILDERRNPGEENAAPVPLAEEQAPVIEEKQVPEIKAEALDTPAELPPAETKAELVDSQAEAEVKAKLVDSTN